MKMQSPKSSAWFLYAPAGTACKLFVELCKHTGVGSSKLRGAWVRSTHMWRSAQHLVRGISSQHIICGISAQQLNRGVSAQHLQFFGLQGHDARHRFTGVNTTGDGCASNLQALSIFNAQRAHLARAGHEQADPLIGGGECWHHVDHWRAPAQQAKLGNGTHRL